MWHKNIQLVHLIATTASSPFSLWRQACSSQAQSCFNISHIRAAPDFNVSWYWNMMMQLGWCYTSDKQGWLWDLLLTDFAIFKCLIFDIWTSNISFYLRYFPLARYISELLSSLSCFCVFILLSFLFERQKILKKREIIGGKMLDMLWLYCVSWSNHYQDMCSIERVLCLRLLIVLFPHYWFGSKGSIWAFILLNVGGTGKLPI